MPDWTTHKASTYYSYVGNNPLSRADPNGHFWLELLNKIRYGEFTRHSAGAMARFQHRQAESLRTFYQGITYTPKNGATVEVDKLSDSALIQWNKDHRQELAAGGLIIAGAALYRGGTSLAARAIDVKIDPGTGLVQPGRGISVNTNSSGLERFCGAQEIDPIPEGLEVIQRGGNSSHYEISPNEPMSMSRYQELLNQVKFKGQ